MPKATVEDIARHAGLSSATVGRVLNDRGGVSESAKAKIATAVRDLGYRQLPDSISDKVRDVLNFLFLIPERQSAFVKMFEQAVAQASRAVDDVEVCIDIRHIPFDSDEVVVNELDAISEDDVQGVALFAVDAPGVRQAVERMRWRGIEVVTLISDIPGATSNFIGINNVSAGRLAGNLLGRFMDKKQGPVAIVCGTARLRDQIDRIYGFRQIMDGSFPYVEVLPPLEGNSFPDANYMLLKKVMEQHPNLAAIYSSSAGNSGVLKAVTESGHRPTIIMHELTPMVREALSRGQVDAVISQNVDHIARSAVRILRAKCFDRPIFINQEKIRIDIYLQDNIS